MGEVGAVPKFATHYFISSRPPFLNLSDVADHEIDNVLALLKAEHGSGTNLRRFGALYMALRAETERRLRERFEKDGGVIGRLAPHYFTLGASPWFAALSPAMRSIEVPLADLPPESTTVTWYDSFAAMGAGAEFGLPVAPPGFVGVVHRIEDLPQLVAAHGLPQPSTDTTSDPMTADHTFVEIQLWTDEPIREYLRPTR